MKDCLSFYEDNWKTSLRTLQGDTKIIYRGKKREPEAAESDLNGFYCIILLGKPNVTYLKLVFRFGTGSLDNWDQKDG